MKKPTRLLIVVLALTAPPFGTVTKGQTAPGQGAAATAKGQLQEPTAKARKGSNDPLTVEVWPRVAVEKGGASIRTRVQPDARSRALTIEWWTTDFVGGSHLISLEGDQSASRHDYLIKGLAAGEYVVTAILKRNDGTQVKRETSLLVAGVGVESDAYTHPPQRGDLQNRNDRAAP
jgi:hypothetical protein